MHKTLLQGLIGAVLIAAVLTVIQIWFHPMEWATFAKAIGTLLILFVVAGFLLVVRSDFGSQKKLKDDNYLD